MPQKRDISYPPSYHAKSWRSVKQNLAAKRVGDARVRFRERRERNNPICGHVGARRACGEHRPGDLARRSPCSSGRLAVFDLVAGLFLASIFLFGIYAYSRRGDRESLVPLPSAFLVSTACLIAISGLVHSATRSIRKDKFRLTSSLLAVSSIAAILFTVIQCLAMIRVCSVRRSTEAPEKESRGWWSCWRSCTRFTF